MVKQLWMCLMTSFDFQDKHGKKRELISARLSLNCIHAKRVHAHTHTCAHTYIHTEIHPYKHTQQYN